MAPAAADSPSTPTANAGSRIYTPTALSFYNAVVLRLSNTFAWKCPTASVLLPFFAAHFSRRHLDVGVGSGYYPCAALAGQPDRNRDRSAGGGGGSSSWPRISPPDGSGDGGGDGASQILTLLDLNESALAAARGLVAGQHPATVITTVHADATRPLPAPLAGARFDSISCMYLLHCLGGTLVEKARLLAVLKRQLTPRGVLFGSTILGRAKAKGEGGAGAEAPLSRLNLFGWVLMSVYNAFGVFHNWDDSAEGLRDVLEAQFEEVEMAFVGRVALFVARTPRLD